MASSRVRRSSAPVRTKVFPASGPRRGASALGQWTPAFRSFAMTRRFRGSRKNAATWAATTGPTSGTVLEPGRVGRHQRLEIAEMTRQGARRRLADLPDAEGVEETGESRRLASGQRREHVRRGFVAQAREPRELPVRQPIEIADIGDEALLDELVDELVAETPDVHRPPGGEVPEALLALGRAAQLARAPGSRLRLSRG